MYMTIMNFKKLFLKMLLFNKKEIIGKQDIKLLMME